MKAPKLSGISIPASLALPFALPAMPFLTSALPALLGLLLFLSFMKIDYTKFRLRKEIFYYPALSIIVFPLAAFFLSRGMDADLRAGFILLAAAPAATSSPAMSAIINADTNLSVLLAVSSNILSPLVYIAALFIFGISFPPQQAVNMLISIVPVLALPFLASLLAAKSRRISGFIRKKASLAGSILFPAVVFIAVSASKTKIEAAPTKDLLHIAAVAALLCALFFIAGAALPGNSGEKKSVALMFGHKNTAVTIWAAINSISPAAALPAVIYIVFHHAANSILAWKFRRG